MWTLIHQFGTAGYSNALCAPPSLLDASVLTAKISMAEFYCYRFMQRYDSGARVAELPFACGRLFQQYMVDAYSKIESIRLDGIVRNQDKLRHKTLQGLIDYLATGNDIDPVDPPHPLQNLRRLALQLRHQLRLQLLQLERAQQQQHSLDRTTAYLIRKRSLF